MQISLAVLRHSSARRLFGGQLVSQICDKMMSVGLVWMFTERYPASMIPVFLGVSALPHLLLAWHAGAWTSRWGHVRTLWVSDLFRAMVYAILAIGWGGWSQSLQLDLLLVASFVANMAGAAFNPAVMSAPAALAEPEQVQQLTALIESCFSIGNVVGPLLSAVLYPWCGLAGLFLINSISYAWAAAAEAGIRTQSNGVRPSLVAEPGMAQAIAADSASPATTRQVLQADSLVTAMLAGFLASNLFLTPIMVIMPLFVKACYHGQIGLLAGLEMAFGVGTVAGAILLSTVQFQSNVGKAIVGSMAAAALAYLAFSLSSAAWVGDACLVLLGFCLATTNVLSMTIFQQRLPAQDVPTLMSLVNLISVASLPLSMVAVGFLVVSVDIRTLAVGCAVGLALASLAVVSRRDVQRL